MLNTRKYLLNWMQGLPCNNTGCTITSNFSCNGMKVMMNILHKSSCMSANPQCSHGGFREAKRAAI